MDDGRDVIDPRRDPVLGIAGEASDEGGHCFNTDHLAMRESYQMLLFSIVLTSACKQNPRGSQFEAPANLVHEKGAGAGDRDNVATMLSQDLDIVRTSPCCLPSALWSCLEGVEFEELQMVFLECLVGAKFVNYQKGSEFVERLV
ncbi:hypothetical protein RRG08_061175 [Elysia crispata]|uniref:Uncharacterized protein n=1 Tax=Elysia crispata TaxID=231223 RepID=A0AAE0XDJ8_9GAST|nr:hypothetical protein RRG08_061175 [Elysia crispata]